MRLIRWVVRAKGEDKFLSGAHTLVSYNRAKVWHRRADAERRAGWNRFWNPNGGFDEVELFVAVVVIEVED